MTTIPADLQAFLDEPQDSREYRRALAVHGVVLGFSYAMISQFLGVTPGFVSQAKQAYDQDGVDGLRLQYRGARPALTPAERQTVLAWLRTQPT